MGIRKKLTVSLIVKNEEQYLRDCLNAIRKLTEEVDGEIIVTDTGSSDKTVEIAEELADLVLHVSWNDDFAAARNAALPYAKGAWFMYVDADEILDENLSDAVSFFQSGEDANYNTASIRIRNYKEHQNVDNYTDFLGIRLWKMRPNIHFEGVIHETIPYELPVRALDVIAHHFGYIGMNEGQQEKKLERNRKLLENQPTTLRNLLQLADTYSQDFEKRIEILEQAKNMLLEGSASEKRPEWRPVIYLSLIRNYYNLQNTNRIKELLEEYWKQKESRENFASEIDLLLYEGNSLLGKSDADPGELKLAQKILDQFESLQKKLDAGELETPDLHITYLIGPLDKNRYFLRLRIADFYIKERDWRGARNALSGIDLKVMKRAKLILHYLKREFDYAKESKDGRALLQIYKSIIFMDDQKTLADFRGLFQKCFPLGEESSDLAIAALAKGTKKEVHYLQEDPFLQLCNICSGGISEKEKKQLVQKIIIKEELKNGNFFCELIYQSIVQNLSLGEIRRSIKENVLAYWISETTNIHEDFPIKILQWLKEQSFESDWTLFELQWRSYFTANGLFCLVKEEIDEQKQEESLLLTEVLCLAGNDDEGKDDSRDAKEKSGQERKKVSLEKVQEYFDILINDLRVILKRLYHREALEPEILSSLPELHQVGYYGDLAFIARTKEDNLMYLKNLKEIASISPGLSGAVKLLSDQVRQETQRKCEKAQTAELEEKKQEVSAEFQILAASVKDQILSLACQERYQEAESVLEMYRKINPKDPQIGELVMQVQQKGEKGRLQ